MTSSQELPYTSPSAFDTALRDRLQTASVESPYSVAELRRQFAYDRILVRVFSVDPGRWILKGGGGMLARIPDQARHSMDIDLFYRGELESAVEALQEIAADNSFGDFFSFDVTKEPDLVPGLSPVVIPGLQVVDYVVYPMVDHVADKHAAMIDTYGHGKRPSTRYRDLVDLVLMATTQRLDAGELRTALLSEYEHRGLVVPVMVEAPDGSWEAGYAREAAKVPHLDQQTLAEALAVVYGLLAPVLDGTASGFWDPAEQLWIDSA